MEPLILYHGSCADGFASAWVAHKVMPDAEFIPVFYGCQPPDVSGREVFILDFSYKRDVLCEMVEKAKYINVLDHHKSAELALSGLALNKISVRFDMNKSGGRLTWEHFFPNESAPWLVEVTEDRDLWRWKIENSKKISAWLASVSWTFESWDLFDNPGYKELESRIEQGAAILRYQNKQIEKQVENAVEIELSGHKVLAVNATMLISEIAGKLAENRPFGVSYFVRSDGKVIYSLRSDKNGVDVSEIARKLGGGGHPNAAGFETKSFIH